MKWVGALWGLLLILLLTLDPPYATAQDRQPPYYASIDKGRARMRSGPSTDYPSSWEYRRRDLPVKVVAVYQSWRKIEDPDGTTGWMHVRLLSDTRTAMVINGTQPMHSRPSDNAPIRYRAEQGVVGRINDCDRDWCAFDVNGRQGYIRTDAIWGDDD